MTAINPDDDDFVTPMGEDWVGMTLDEAAELLAEDEQF